VHKSWVFGKELFCQDRGRLNLKFMSSVNFKLWSGITCLMKGESLMNGGSGLCPMTYQQIRPSATCSLITKSHRPVNTPYPSRLSF